MELSGTVDRNVKWYNQFVPLVTNSWLVSAEAEYN